MAVQGRDRRLISPNPGPIDVGVVWRLHPWHCPSNGLTTQGRRQAGATILARKAQGSRNERAPQKVIHADEIGGPFEILPIQAIPCTHMHAHDAQDGRWEPLAGPGG